MLNKLVMQKYTLITTIRYLLSVPLVFIVFSLNADPGPGDPPSDKNRVYTIVVDPGHGGKDAGCSGKHSREKDIVLAISKKIREITQQKYPSLRVIMTRDSDEFIPLHQRAMTANKEKADLFLSVHCNSISGRPHVHGSETYVLGLHRAEDNLRVAKRENAAILYEEDYKKNYDGFDPSSSAGHIILSMVQNAHLESSIQFANLIESHMSQTAERKSRGVKQAGFLVLRETTMPSVLIETGFLTNKSEEDFLRDEKGQLRVAKSIVQAIEDYALLPETEEIADDTASPAPRFGIQLAVTSQPLDDTHPLRKKCKDLREWKCEAGFKYLVPAGDNRRYAENIQKKIRNTVCDDAFIIQWPKEEISLGKKKQTK